MGRRPHRPGPGLEEQPVERSEELLEVHRRRNHAQQHEHRRGEALALLAWLVAGSGVATGVPVHLKDIHLEKGMQCVDCHNHHKVIDYKQTGYSEKKRAPITTVLSGRET